MKIIIKFYLRSSAEKVSSTIEFCIFELVFRLNWQFRFFIPNFPQKGCFWSKTEKNEHQHRILKIGFNLDTKLQLKLGEHPCCILSAKFQLKLKILIFWSKLAQKACFPSKTEKSEHHYRILHIIQISLATKFHLEQTIFFLDQMCAKKVFHNHFHNILKPFDIWTNLLFTTGEMMHDYYL